MTDPCSHTLAPVAWRCQALLWYARHPEADAGHVRCARVTTNRIVGTDAIVCDLHADAVRLGHTIRIVEGPVSGDVLEPLDASVPIGARRRCERIRAGERNAGGVPTTPSRAAGEFR